ncbi:MAG: glycine--tRNA ligase subunit beta [Rickettsiales bacterium]|nr:glycine--tRNA ligase subunit beta [Rickettsiales bacterium]
MKDFLLELTTEEIPALAQKNAERDLANIVEDCFIKEGLNLSKSQIKTFATAQRISCYINNLEEVIEVNIAGKVGPKINAPEIAINGFLKANNIESLDQLTIIEHNQQKCYFISQSQKFLRTIDIIESSLAIILQKMTNSFAKSMKWSYKTSEGYENAKWIRPVRNICILFGEETLKFSYFGLIANNQIFALDKKIPISLSNANQYLSTLASHQIIANFNERKAFIIQEVQKISSSLNLEPIDNPNSSNLYDEVAGMCESPNGLVAKIDEKFSYLPDEVLILTLKLNQRYFCLKKSDSSLSQNFIFFNNIEESVFLKRENQEKIIKDHQKLVKARLSDASFFIEEDLKSSFIERQELLKNVVFHQKAGSIYNKTIRIHEISKFLSLFVKGCDISSLKQACNLCKNDLTTKLVAEMPELQGKIGSFYAMKQGFDKKISASIYEHYLPGGNSGINAEMPQTALGTVISIADKIDSIVTLFLIQEKPTSSRDPLGIRRMALAIIKICFDKNIDLPLKTLIQKSIKTNILLLKNISKNQKLEFETLKNQTTQEVIKFFGDRIKFYLKDQMQFRIDIISSVIDYYFNENLKIKDINLLTILKKVQFLQSALSKDSSDNKIVRLYKRAINILEIEEAKDKISYEGKPSRLLMKESAEKKLYKRIKKLNKEVAKLLAKLDFAGSFLEIETLNDELENFFTKVTINDKNSDIRKNRLLIIANIRVLFNQIADFSKIEI